MKLALIGNTISAAFWNLKVIGALRQEDACPGAHIRLLKLPCGQLVSVADSGLYQHPWFTSLAWDPKKAKWLASVRPGFVNGDDPTVVQADGKHVPLCDNPLIPLSAFEATGNSFPKFFESLGVQKVKNNVSINLAAEKIVVDETHSGDASGERRYLQSCELFVSVARPTYQLDATIQGNLVTGQIVDYTVTYDATALQGLGSRARLQHAASMPGNYEPTLSGRLAGVFGDDGEDRIRVAKIFFLSPADFTPEEKKPFPPPDGYWTPFVVHSLFWNLCHAARNLPPVNVKQSSRDPFLSAFIGRYTVAPMATLGAMEAESQRLLLASMNSTANQGKFWTV